MLGRTPWAWTGSQSTKSRWSNCVWDRPGNHLGLGIGLAPLAKGGKKRRRNQHCKGVWGKIGHLNEEVFSTGSGWLRYGRREESGSLPLMSQQPCLDWEHRQKGRSLSICNWWDINQESVLHRELRLADVKSREVKVTSWVPKGGDRWWKGCRRREMWTG